MLAGPIGTFAANVLVLLVSLHLLGQREFESISLVLILAQFTWSAWSALFSAPLPVVLESSEPCFEDPRVACMMLISIVAALAAALLYFFVANGFEVSTARRNLLRCLGTSSQQERRDNPDRVVRSLPLLCAGQSYLWPSHLALSEYPSNWQKFSGLLRQS